MSEKKEIPILNIDEISKFHQRSITWLPIISDSKHKNYHINRVEDISNKSRFQVLPHRKTLCDFFYLRKGSAKRSKGLDIYEMTGPAIFLLPPYQITEHKTLSEDAAGFYCHFDDKIFTGLRKKYLSEEFPFFQQQSNPVIEITGETQGAVESILERLYYLYRSDKEYNEALVSRYLSTLFEELKVVAPKTSALRNIKADALITKRYKQLLAHHIYEYQQLSDYANLLHVTPNYLNKCVKTATDKTAQELLKEMLILEAKTLIKHSNLNVSEIAVKLCDQTPSNFARFFKKQTGLTPKEYSQKY